MQIYFVRHGESLANVEWIISNRDLDHPLTERGIEQASALAEALRPRGISYLASSPVLRARQTADIVASHLGLQVAVEGALREFDCGIMEGRGDEKAWAAHGAVFRSWVREGRWDARIEGGESFLDVHDRFVPYVRGIVATYQGSDSRVCLLGHGGLFLCMLPLIMTNVDTDAALEWRVPYTAPIVAEPVSGPESPNEDGAFLVCTSWGEADLWTGGSHDS